MCVYEFSKMHKRGMKMFWSLKGFAQILLNNMVIYIECFIDKFFFREFISNFVHS